MACRRAKVVYQVKSTEHKSGHRFLQYQGLQGKSASLRSRGSWVRIPPGPLDFLGLDAEPIAAGSIVNNLLTMPSWSSGPVYDGARGQIHSNSLSSTQSPFQLPIAMPTMTFEIPNAKLLTEEERQIEIRKQDALFRILSGPLPLQQQQPTTAIFQIYNGPIPTQQQPSQPFSASINPPPEIDWPKFKEWLAKKYSRGHSHDLYNTALKYYECAFYAAKAAQLTSLSIDKRRHVMQSLAALSKFLGRYQEWQKIRADSGLQWKKPTAVSIVRSLLSNQSIEAYERPNIRLFLISHYQSYFSCRS